MRLDDYRESSRCAVLERDDAGVLTIRLNRKGGPLMWGGVPHAELPELFAAVASDRDNRVVILTGTGDTFIGMTGTHFGPDLIDPDGWDRILYEGLRLVNNLEVGTLDGTVAPELIVEGCVPAVYLYTGADVVPDDIGSATPPLATTAVNLDNTTGAYRFRLGFVPTGTHTVAFTCGADDDGAESDDAIVFSAPQNVDILAGQTTTVEFAATP